MRHILAGFTLLVLILPAAAAATPLESYLASRDAYVAKFSKAENPHEEERARADLEQQLRAIIGPVDINGFSAGKLNLDALTSGDLGFGLLDGLLYSTPDKAQIVVTTGPLLDHWLREHKDWWGPKLANVPQTVGAALKSEAFYTQALRGDAAISIYADIPVVKPANAKLAVAMLDVRRQATVKALPDEIIMSVVTAERVFVISATVKAQIGPLPACDRAWDASKKQRTKAARTEDDPDEKADAAFRRCFAEWAKSAAFFPAVTRQAQALIDLLPQ